jgi:hypothetical protein
VARLLRPRFTVPNERIIHRGDSTEIPGIRGVVQVSSLEDSIAFFEVIGLREIRRRPDEKGRYTNVVALLVTMRADGGSQVRTGLSAGGKRIRTHGPTPNGTEMEGRPHPPASSWESI